MIKVKFLAVGVMSGTSMDGIDISLILSDGKKSYKHIKSKFYNYKKYTKTILSNPREKSFNCVSLLLTCLQRVS